MAHRGIVRIDTRRKTVDDWRLGIGDDVGSRPYPYRSVDDLAAWIQTKLAVLLTLDPQERSEEIEGVGQRVSTHVFWVYPSANEMMESLRGKNPRGKSKARGP